MPGRATIGGVLFAATILVGFMSSPRSAQAQGIFCPTSVAGQSGIALSNGTCTNGATGAFSNAALASQALTDLSQSTSQEASLRTTSAIATRREEEAERCPEGFERVAGTCRRVAGPAAPAPPARVATGETLAPPPGRAQRPKRRVRHAAPPAAPPPVAAVPPPIYKAPPPVAALPRYGAWATGWGDYERRTGTGASSINCCQAVGDGGLPIPLVLTAESKAVAGGVLGGVDMTFRSLVGADDGLIAGVLGGGLASHVNMTTTSVPVGPNATGNLLPGFSTLSANLDGPSVGAYLTYFNGGFSSDLTFRADFLNISESFTDVQAFTANVIGGIGFGPVTAPFASNGSAGLINLSTTGNLNYRFHLANGYWIEPTGGFLYVASNYDSGAAQLGLADGHLLRLQAGTRFGSDFYFDRWRVTVSLTGLAYDDVSVTGGVFEGALFGPTNTILAQQGELKGQGILAFNIDHGNGVSTFVQGDVRGGENLFGGGGRAGVRIQW